MFFLFYVLHLFGVITNVQSLRLRGTWNTNKTYTFLSKFAFQKTEVDEIETTRGYIYGNVTRTYQSKFDFNKDIPPATLVIVDGEYVTDLYGNASRPLQFFGDVSDNSMKSLWLAENARCRAMFSRINGLAWHRHCQPNAKMDFFRQVPCPWGNHCAEEDDRSRVLPNSQFTFTVQDRRQPRYWYLSLIACWRNETTCEWETSAVPRPDSVSTNGTSCVTASKLSSKILNRGNVTELSSHLCLPVSVDYDIWMVNGVPRLQGYYRFEHQFSFEDHDIFELYLVFGILYVLTAIIFHIKFKGEYQPLPILLFSHLWLCFIAALLHTIHFVMFSFDGHGIPILSSIGAMVHKVAESILLILLLVTAEVGFPIYPQELSHFERKVRRYRKLHSQPLHIMAGDEERNPVSALSLPATWTASRTHFFDWQVESDVLTSKLDDQKINTTSNNILNNQQSGKSYEHLKLYNYTGGNLKRIITYIGFMVFIVVSLELGLYIWALYDQDPVLEISVWNTTPGRLLVAVRMAVCFWFLFIMRNNHKDDFSKFIGVVEPLHFAAAFLLWLLSTPAIVFLAETSISPLWRKKTVIGVTYFFNFLSSILFAQLIDRSNAAID